MNRSVIAWIFGGAVALGLGAFAWLWFAGGSGEPSTELTTPTIASEPTTTVPAPSESESTQAGDDASSSAMIFTIEAGGESVASFEIDEELRGEPVRVVGTTTEVAAQVEVDLGDLSTAQLSDIVVNARTFATDSERRDRAIRGPIILNSASDEFEFLTFSPTSIGGLSGALEVGETVEFTVTGDLTIRDTTNEVTFEVEASLMDERTISGSASTVVLRSEFDIGIPNVPSVANVSDEVTIALDFVAVSS